MPQPAKRDNSTRAEKVRLRRRVLGAIAEPVVLETHGGLGRLGDACYRAVTRGCVFETDARKAALLARKRPTWAVYQGDCVAALAAGAGAHLPVNLLDLDPYGEPWPALEAFFSSERPRVPILAVVVNDGLRQKVLRGGAWQVASLEAAVARWGNDLYARYLEVARELLAETAARAGYMLADWTGYYCGYNGQMTHYAATLRRGGAGIG